MWAKKEYLEVKKITLIRATQITKETEKVNQ
jgi:hypothetical protein